MSPASADPEPFPLPTIIQGGMGVGVSDWRLANAVSLTGQLGVVSGTALDQVMVRRLQDGDPGGHMRRALLNFPFRPIAERILSDFFVSGGKSPTQQYVSIPAPALDMPTESSELYIAANFVEIFLAREGHGNPVGINYLEKIQAPHLPSIYGAMLAGVDFVLIGAGIPTRIPGVLDALANQSAVTYPFQVSGALEEDRFTLAFDPSRYPAPAQLKRPVFLAIIASNVLATTLLKRSNGRVDGFIVEAPTAGGHNAPPRGKLQLTDDGEPIYGERDAVDLSKLRALGVPFWLAGGCGSPEKLQAAIETGAAGIQVGTPFAFCNESGLQEDFKAEVLTQIRAGTARIFTDPLASPTGFPFKVLCLEGTASESDVYRNRPRVCDLGYLREPYRAESGVVAYRCAGEPASVYASKGGLPEDTRGRKCLCNGLLANIGLPQTRAAGRRVEPGLLTAGDDLSSVVQFLPLVGLTYGAAEVVEKLFRTLSYPPTSSATNLNRLA